LKPVSDLEGVLCLSIAAHVIIKVSWWLLSSSGVRSMWAC